MDFVDETPTDATETVALPRRPPGNREKRTIFAYVRLCSLMFA